MTQIEKLEQARDTMKKWLQAFKPVTSITLGSGLGYMTELLEDSNCLSYSEIPNCPVPSVTSHEGCLWWGYLEGVPVIMLQGRVHLYEGFDVHEVVFLTRLMVMLGIKQLIITHATGAVTRNLEPGDIVGIRSQIAMNCPDPTSGSGIEKLGAEFTMLEDVFCPDLLHLAKSCALEEKVSFHRGVSVFKWGRSFETVAEVEQMSRIGADVATMSTVPEVIAAAHMGAKVLDLALVSDMGPGLGGAVAQSHQHVLEVVEKMKKPFGRLVVSIVSKMGQK